MLESCCSNNNVASRNFNYNSLTINGPKFSIAEEPESEEKTNIFDNFTDGRMSSIMESQNNYKKHIENVDSFIMTMKTEAEEMATKHSLVINNLGGCNKPSFMSSLKKNEVGGIKANGNFMNRDSLMKFGLHNVKDDRSSKY